MLLAPQDTDIPPQWINELLRAREAFDMAEESPDGSEQRQSLLDIASDIEERAISDFGS
jgi:hypothetical protein